MHSDTTMEQPTNFVDFNCNEKHPINSKGDDDVESRRRKKSKTVSDKKDKGDKKQRKEKKEKQDKKEKKDRRKKPVAKRDHISRSHNVRLIEAMHDSSSDGLSDFSSDDDKLTALASTQSKALSTDVIDPNSDIIHLPNGGTLLLSRKSAFCLEQESFLIDRRPDRNSDELILYAADDNLRNRKTFKLPSGLMTKKTSSSASNELIHRNKTAQCFQPLSSVMALVTDQRRLTYEKHQRSLRYFGKAGREIGNSLLLPRLKIDVLRKSRCERVSRVSRLPIEGSGIIPVTPFNNIDEEISSSSFNTSRYHSTSDDAAVGQQDSVNLFDVSHESIVTDAQVHEASVRSTVKNLNIAIRESPDDIDAWLNLIQQQPTLLQLQQLAGGRHGPRHGGSNDWSRAVVEKRLEIVKDAIAKFPAVIRREGLALLYLALLRFVRIFSEPERIRLVFTDALFSSSLLHNNSLSLLLHWENWRSTKQDFSIGTSIDRLVELSRTSFYYICLTSLQCETERLVSQGFKHASSVQREDLPIRLQEDLECLDVDFLIELMNIQEEGGHTERNVASIQQDIDLGDGGPWSGYWGSEFPRLGETDNSRYPVGQSTSTNTGTIRQSSWRVGYRCWDESRPSSSLSSPSSSPSSDSIDDGREHIARSLGLFDLLREPAFDAVEEHAGDVDKEKTTLIDMVDILLRDANDPIAQQYFYPMSTDRQADAEDTIDGNDDEEDAADSSMVYSVVHGYRIPVTTVNDSSNAYKRAFNTLVSNDDDDNEEEEKKNANGVRLEDFGLKEAVNSPIEDSSVAQSMLVRSRQIVWLESLLSACQFHPLRLSRDEDLVQLHPHRVVLFEDIKSNLALLTCDVSRLRLLLGCLSILGLQFGDTTTGKYGYQAIFKNLLTFQGTSNLESLPGLIGTLWGAVIEVMSISVTSVVGEATSAADCAASSTVADYCRLLSGQASSDEFLSNVVLFQSARCSISCTAKLLRAHRMTWMLPIRPRLDSKLDFAVRMLHQLLDSDCVYIDARLGNDAAVLTALRCGLLRLLLERYLINKSAFQLEQDKEAASQLRSELLSDCKWVIQRGVEGDLALWSSYIDVLNAVGNTNEAKKTSNKMLAAMGMQLTYIKNSNSSCSLNMHTASCRETAVQTIQQLQSSKAMTSVFLFLYATLCQSLLVNYNNTNIINNDKSDIDAARVDRGDSYHGSWWHTPLNIIIDFANLDLKDSYFAIPSLNKTAKKLPSQQQGRVAGQSGCGTSALLENIAGAVEVYHDLAMAMMLSCRQEVLQDIEKLSLEQSIHATRLFVEPAPVIESLPDVYFTVVLLAWLHYMKGFLELHYCMDKSLPPNQHQEMVSSAINSACKVLDASIDFFVNILLPGDTSSQQGVVTSNSKPARRTSSSSFFLPEDLKTTNDSSTRQSLHEALLHQVGSGLVVGSSRSVSRLLLVIESLHLARLEILAHSRRSLNPGLASRKGWWVVNPVSTDRMLQSIRAGLRDFPDSCRLLTCLWATEMARPGGYIRLKAVANNKRRDASSMLSLNVVYASFELFLEVSRMVYLAHQQSLNSNFYLSLCLGDNDGLATGIVDQRCGNSSYLLDPRQWSVDNRRNFLAFIERLLCDPEVKSLPWMWRVYISIQLQESAHVDGTGKPSSVRANLDVVKKVLFRSIRSCPLAKQLWTNFELLRPIQSLKERQDIGHVMEEKGIYWRTQS